MSARSITSRYALGPAHAIVKVRVSFDRASGRSFHDSVGELVDSIGVLPGTTPEPVDPDQLDLVLVGVEEDQFEGPGAKRGIAEFAVPTAVLPDVGAIPLMLAIATYGSVYRFVREYQVLDVAFPSEAMPQHDLPGPKFGGDLIPTERPGARLGLILKPRFISSESRLRSLVGQVARAGIDYITDDELTVATPDLPFERRVAIVTQELQRVKRDTGRSVPFIANVTGGYPGAMKRATMAEELGARAVMVNTIAMGYDVVSEIASDSDRGLGIVANSIGRGVMTSGPEYRVVPELLCKLARLAGADGVYTGPLVGSIATMSQHAERYRSALTQPYHRACSRKPSAAVMSGGLGLPEIIENERLYRGDLFLSLGRDFIRAMLAGIEAAVLLDCFRSVWEAVRDEGVSHGREIVMRLNDRGSEYRECLRAIRAEEAVT